MAVITFEEHLLQSEDGESVLDTLLRNDLDVAYSCKSGLCHSCMMRCTEGEIPAEAQKDIKPNLKKQGYFLSCQCIPREDISISKPDDADMYIHAELVEKQSLSATVCRLGFRPFDDFDYSAGQYVNLKRQDGLVRSYSLASLPSEDKLLELHVKRMRDGKMSNWLIDELMIGDSIQVQGPLGDCFYNEEASQQPILMIGSGTGLAPLLGVLRDALHHGHQADIFLYHAARNVGEHYLDEQLNELTSQYENLKYIPITLQDMDEEVLKAGEQCDRALDDHPSLSGWQVYLCGAPAMVKSLKMKAYLAGANMKDIYTDPFEDQK